jgi:predicted secreted protein
MRPGDSTAVAPSSSAAAVGSPRVYDPSSSSIEAKVGETFTIALPGSTSTPFEWRLDSVGESAVVRLTGEATTESPPSGCAGCTGYRGAFTFTFTASAAGTTKVRFAYASVAPPGSAPSKVVTFEVHVR